MIDREYDRVDVSMDGVNWNEVNPGYPVVLLLTNYNYIRVRREGPAPGGRLVEVFKREGAYDERKEVR
jgi:hypothetical protein